MTLYLESKLHNDLYVSLNGLSKPLILEHNNWEWFFMTNECRVCGSIDEHIIYIVREMMIGCRDEFEYFECSKCKCLQISKTPKDLNKYYPRDYYSYSTYFSEKQSGLKLFFRRHRTKYFLKKTNIIGLLYSRLKGPPLIPSWVAKAKIHLNSKILDVGCGNGNLLLRLSEQGFTNLIGVDPFIEKDIFYDNGVSIHKSELEDLHEKFDCIMLNHSFEHVTNPSATMASLFDKITSNGVVIIRIPTVSSFAWRKYRENWVQLDAPRHLFLHSIDSVSLLAKQNGFIIDFIDYDSTEFQFYGSEQYKKNIPLKDKKSYSNNPSMSIFTEHEIEEFKIQASELNRIREGDQICICLKKDNQ